MACGGVTIALEPDVLRLAALRGRPSGLTGEEMRAAAAATAACAAAEEAGEVEPFAGRGEGRMPEFLRLCALLELSLLCC